MYNVLTKVPGPEQMCTLHWLVLLSNVLICSAMALVFKKNKGLFSQLVQNGKPNLHSWGTAFRLRGGNLSKGGMGIQ